MIDKNRIRGRIVEKFGNQEHFASAVNLSDVTVSKKLNGKSTFSQDDIELWSKELGIDQKDIGIYFFA